MKKAVIATGGKQYVVSEGDELDVELLNTTEELVDFEPLLVIDGEITKIGTPTVKESKVTASIKQAELKTDKVVAIRYKAKKRVHKVRGHRQLKTKIKITKIA